MKTVRIDGAQGEGGGQVLRSSLTLAILTGSRLEIERIRAGRARPGLMRQHRVAVEAACAICDGEVVGAELGSTRVTFTPDKVRGGDYRFAIGTAGSANLVLQTILLPLVFADTASTVILEGGTHNGLSPPFEFLTRTFLPILERMGARVALTLERPGFYPAGGGRMVVRVEPVAKLARIDVLERGALVAKRGRVLLSNLPRSIADRQTRLAASMLGWPANVFSVEEVESAGPGNVLQAEIESEAVCEVVSAFGDDKTSAEEVVAELVDETRAYLASDAPVGVHLADQLLLPFAIAGGGVFRAVGLTLHTRTNALVLRRFLETEVTFDEAEHATTVSVG